jgi:hypothetical protein
MNRSFWTYSSLLLLLLAMLTACGQSPAPAVQTPPDASQSPISIGDSPDTAKGPISIGGGPSLGLDPANQRSHGGAVTNHVSFVDQLRAQGLMVEPVNSVEQPFLAVKGELLRLQGGELKQPAEVQSFEYANIEAVTAEVAQIDADGNPKDASVSWQGTPHFFQKDKLLVLYVGDDPAVLGHLSGLLGAQVAGR